MIWIKKLVSIAIHNNFLWKILDATVIRASLFALRERDGTNQKHRKSAAEVERGIELITAELVVKHGVFSGMRYPSRESIGSSFVPKILGSYEQELKPALEKICATPYSNIVDIGCAEGYYAVGLAMQIPSSQIYAFDINEDAIALCRKMADLNNVSSRMTYGSYCDSKILGDLDLAEKSLILSDCEGFEAELFSTDLITKLQNHDFLIETHDFIDITISSQLISRFETSHTITKIQSLDDIQKALHYDYEELTTFDLETKRLLLAEYRPATMEWLYMTPRNDYLRPQ